MPTREHWDAQSILQLWRAFEERVGQVYRRHPDAALQSQTARKILRRQKLRLQELTRADLVHCVVTMDAVLVKRRRDQLSLVDVSSSSSSSGGGSSVASAAGGSED